MSKDIIYSNYPHIFRMSPEVDVIFVDFQECVVRSVLDIWLAWVTPMTWEASITCIMVDPILLTFLNLLEIPNVSMEIKYNKMNWALPCLQFVSPANDHHGYFQLTS